MFMWTAAIWPTPVIKLSCRGSFQTVELITDVEPFLRVPVIISGT